jgi:hypothetical protein
MPVLAVGAQELQAMGLDMFAIQRDTAFGATR